ncbi:hypothetical protein OCGS_1183 [Oceaniovalibus guishaninsula JLT2003]|uniref:Uncharacterized protein n=1 Tax=Oceaniovalibus guishaninsula JLT2003 TaxID=1231392 RepID=K2I708_9RHOB|nr:hypothetical protein [Oceaniovalibus guishaninsula]EKE44800.1 hypothetical protein OCGS_1183 [Oceaniovalibus guishaninsula JLT2003]
MKSYRMTAVLAAATLALTVPVTGWAATFKAALTELNGSGVSGSVIFDVDRTANTLRARAEIFGLTPDRLHVNHIHGRFNDDGTPRDSILPTMDLDDDGDGFVEVLEAAPNYGDILLSLEPALALPDPDPSAVHSGPFADASGVLRYDLLFDLTDDSIFFSPVLGNDYTSADIFPLHLREYVIHGLIVPGGIDPSAPDGGFVATMPVAAAEISPVPLPGAAGLLLLGLSGMGILGRRRMKRPA